MIARFSTALLACSFLTATPAFAQTSPADDIVTLKAQVQAMQEQIEELKGALASQAVQVQKVAALPQVTPPLPKAAAPGWWGGTTITGKAYLNVSNIHQTSTDLTDHRTDNIQNGTETELKRFYIGIDHKFNDVFSANLTTDFRYNTNYLTSPAGSPSRDVLVYVKKAFLQAKLNPALIVRVGAADLPWVPFAEGVYGYRFVENTLIDRTKFGTSSDWGVHLLGSFGPHNMVSYQISAIDGSGYKTLTRNTDTIDLEGRVSVNPIKDITLAVGGYTGKLGKSNATIPDTATPHTASRFNALAAYTNSRIRAGVEYFNAKNWNTVTSTTGDKSHGWSAFGSFAFTPQIAAFGRYDWVKPSGLVVSGVDGETKDNYFNLGVDYKPITPIDLALVYKHERANNGFIATSNGTIGGLDHGDYDEVGVFGQLVF